MLTLPPGTTVLLATGRVDGRKGINGLSALVRLLDVNYNSPTGDNYTSPS